MIKCLICIFAVLDAPAIGTAGDSSVIQQLRKDTVGRSFTLRIPDGGTTCFQNQRLPSPSR